MNLRNKSIKTSPINRPNNNCHRINIYQVSNGKVSSVSNLITL